jgi:hypothetical protein
VFHEDLKTIRRAMGEARGFEVTRTKRAFFSPLHPTTMVFNFYIPYAYHKVTQQQAPRGLSAEEKRVKLVEIFHESVSRSPGRASFVVPDTNYRKISFKFIFSAFMKLSQY